jgi:hypothetical protein
MISRNARYNFENHHKKFQEEQVCNLALFENRIRDELITY